MRLLKALLSTVIAVALVYALNRSWGVVPALGSFISPFTGFWQNAEKPDQLQAQSLTIGGTKQPVEVLFDSLHIPHVFAQNDHDAYFAQGYLTARDRLWQMEFQTHAAAGRVAEIVGDRATELDRYNRRLGMGFAAEQSVKLMMDDPAIRETLEAYSAGINAYINQLKPAQYPLEYKLLGYAPEPWTPIKCAYFLKYMSGVLALGADDVAMTNILAKYGPEVTNDLFPNYPKHEDPIIPPGTKWDFLPVYYLKSPSNPVPGKNGFALNWPRHDPAIGSNNWAVAATKSATGYPILANDPHLNLSLPSIWYLIQLHTPTLNVMGASMPGSPGVIGGFNQHIAWGETNVGSDVLDFYKIKFKDNTRREYWHDNKWKPVTRRVEVVKIKGRPDLVDTVLYTHHGPVMYEPGQKSFAKNFPVGYAVRWVAHDPANELKCFYLLNRAKNHADYREALTYYGAPAQNFVFADVNKDIAIAPNGRFPLKKKQQGKFLLDGTDPNDDWRAYIPADQNPHVKNPPRGFVSSANQSSTDPTYPYYLNWQFAPHERGSRINQRLTAMQRATVDSIRNLQFDTYNIRAAELLPKLLSHLQSGNLSAAQKQALNTLQQWTYNQTTAELGPTIFVEWEKRFMEALWGDELPDSDSLPLRKPSADRTIRLLEENPNARWFDDVRTPVKETVADIVTQSFRATVDTLTKRHGPQGAGWQWATTKATKISHLARLDALSALNVQVGGGATVVNAITSRTGPSWRLVVELGPMPTGYAALPGGQSGNPGSHYYLNMLETWRKGQLTKLQYLTSPQAPGTYVRWKLN
ncbi:penicillin acylase family protein [Fibrella sp. HMF5335]|uniref:Penicillin acylase family protein n=1 Tax=Fibrella rubiginis TaxID=2817060 RepID=A0A939GMV8_9BACT|nr:penicillin acylase family protein [Fibrella rubiginis]MBO0939362.1 penicillin acylase family protein [Fibrella rubiginis]